MARKVDIAIIGAGTAGLSAYKEASKHTRNIVVIDGGQLGTTCARTGCMPSKVLIQTAELYHSRHHFQELGIDGADGLSVDIPRVLSYVRGLRDYFTSGVIKSTEAIGDDLIRANARFIGPNTLEAGSQTIEADNIIIAAGSHTVVPPPWHSFEDKLLKSENFFEQSDLQGPVGVIGAGVIGLELGQALARLGLDPVVYHAGDNIGGLTDPEVNQSAIDILQQEMPIHINERANVTYNQQQDDFTVQISNGQQRVNQLLAATGRAPNLKGLNVEAADIPLDDKGVPVYDETTMRINGTSVFIGGDIDSGRALLHEAADEGRIAGFNACRDQDNCFHRRLPNRIIFTQPNIAVVGQTYAELKNGPIVSGSVSFADQGRARIKKENHGLLKVYADKRSGQLLGSEMIAPQGEHLAHLLAWAIQNRMSVFQVLQLPYYHPTVEEGMRTALRDLAQKVEQQAGPLDLAMCDSDAPL